MGRQQCSEGDLCLRPLPLDRHRRHTAPPRTLLVPEAGPERHHPPAKQYPFTSAINKIEQNGGNSPQGSLYLSVLCSSCFPQNRGEFLREIIVAGVLARVLEVVQPGGYSSVCCYPPDMLVW